MKITLTKFDVQKILINHLGISKYKIDTVGGKPEFYLPFDEIYWEGNPEPGIAGVKEILVCKKNKGEIR